MKTTIITLIALFLAITSAFSEGEHAPIFVVDDDMAAVTGAWIYASTWGARPPSKVGGSAIEEGGGQYYFVIGTCDSCIPSGTYDIIVNGSLDSTYASIPIGVPGTPGPNTIGTDQLINDDILLDEDIENNYGGVVELGTVFDIQAVTVDSTSGDNKIVTIDVVNDATGTGHYPRVHAINTSYESILSDSLDNAILYGGQIDTHNAKSWQTRYNNMGPCFLSGLLKVRKQGIGSYYDIRNQGSSFGGHLGRHSEYAGLYAYMALDSTSSTFWNPHTTAGNPAGIELRQHFNRIGEGWGFMADIYADTSVSWVHGAHLRIYEDGGTAAQYAYGVYTEPWGWDYAYGFKTAVHGRGPNARSHGLHVEVLNDTTAGGTTAHGAYLAALGRAAGQNQGMNRAWGIETVAGADTAWGGKCVAYSDEDQASNKAYGVVGEAHNGVKNYGVMGYALGSSDGYFSITKYGVTGRARGDGYNYGGYFRATDPAAGGTNTALYAWADSSPTANYAAKLKGLVLADSLALPLDNDAWPGAYPTMQRIQLDDDDEVGLYVDAASGGALGDDNTCIWIAGGGMADGDYGLYLTGCQYGITQTNANTTNTLDGKTDIGNLYCTGQVQLYNGNTSGTATISAGDDSVIVHPVFFASGTTKANTTVIVSAIDRPADGNICGARIGESLSGDYGFIVKSSASEATDLEVHWIAVSRGTGP